MSETIKSVKTESYHASSSDISTAQAANIGGVSAFETAVVSQIDDRATFGRGVGNRRWLICAPTTIRVTAASRS